MLHGASSSYSGPSMRNQGFWGLVGFCGLLSGPYSSRPGFIVVGPCKKVFLVAIEK